MATRFTTSPVALPYWGRLNSDEPARHAECHAGAEGQREVLHAGDDGGGQRRQNEGRAGPCCDRDALRGRAQHRGQRGDDAGDDPDQGRQPLDRDPEEAGPVRVVGHRAHGDAGVGAQQEPAEREQDHGHDDGDQQVVAVEEDREDQQVVCAERGGHCAHDRGPAEPARHQDLDPAEELGQPDRHHHDDQARRVEETPADDEVDEQTQGGPDHQAPGTGRGTS